MDMRRRLTFANITALVALFLALCGGSYAAVFLPANSVGAKQLKNGAVTANKLAPSAVTANKLAPSVVLAIAAPPIVVSATGTSAAAAKNSSTISSQTVYCHNNESVFGGGVRLSDESAQFVNDSAPTPDGHGWVADVVNFGPNTPAFTVYALCR
jgi:hypothetical protein